VIPVKAALLALACLSLGVAMVRAQSDAEPAAVVELGAEATRNLKDHTSSSGPSVALEVEPIKNWLELEAGVTTLFRRHSTEWGVDLLFKKPWELSKKVEFMAGIGPEWTHSRDFGVRTSAFGGEAALDLMYWPSAKRRFGWYVEPAYEYSFGRGHERSLGASFGLLIAIP
jgi:hypothetical protein